MLCSFPYYVLKSDVSITLTARKVSKLHSLVIATFSLPSCSQFLPCSMTGCLTLYREKLFLLLPDWRWLFCR